MSTCTTAFASKTVLLATMKTQRPSSANSATKGAQLALARHSMTAKLAITSLTLPTPLSTKSSTKPFALKLVQKASLSVPCHFIFVSSALCPAKPAQQHLRTVSKLKDAIEGSSITTPPTAASPNVLMHSMATRSLGSVRSVLLAVLLALGHPMTSVSLVVQTLTTAPTLTTSESC